MGPRGGADRGHPGHPHRHALLTTPLEVLRRFAADGVPLAPVHAAVHARLRSVASGTCEASMPLRQPEDVDPGVWVLADFVTGLAVGSTLAAGERITTLRLGIAVLDRPTTPTTLRATAVLDDHRDGVALSSGRVSDEAGRTVARAVARNVVLSDAPAGYGDASYTWAASPRTSASMVAAEVDGDGPLHVVGRADPASANTAGAVQGGALASMAVRVLAHGLGGPADEVSATFLRAVPADGAALDARAVVEHAGRRLRSARAEVCDARGRTVLTASGLRYAGF